MLNKVVLMGRLTKDAELRNVGSKNTAVCSFTLAVDRQFAKQGEEREADFINCQAWGKTAEFIESHFSKGNMIAIVGRIQTRSWDDSEGKKRFATEVVVEETSFTGEKKAQNGQSGHEQPRQQAQTQGDAYEPGIDPDELPF